MKKVLVRLFVVFCLVASSILVAPFSVSADTITGFDYDNYYELEYISSSGTQYINTHYTVGNAYRINFKFSPNTSGVSNNAVFSTVVNNESNNMVFQAGSLTQFGQWNTTNGNANITQITPDTSVIYNCAFIKNSTYSSLYIGSYSSGIANPISGGQVYLFRYQTTQGTSVNGRHKLYTFTILENDVVVRNYVPAERKSDNVVGLYETITGSFLQNSGTGSFVGGPRINTTQYTINTNVSPSGSGNVTGGGIYDSGDVVTLTAVPESGYTFDHWNDGSIQNPLTITATSNITYTAYFVGSSPPQTQYTITTNVSPSGSGTVSGGGTYSSGTSITLSAVPNNGYIFSQWSDGVTSVTRSLIVNGDASYTAIFEVIPPTYYTITTNVSPSGSGTVSGSGSYLSGTSVTLSATPSNGYRFSSWSDGNSDNPRTIVLTSNFNVTAYFVDESIVNNIIVGYNLNVVDIERYEDLRSGVNYFITGTVTSRNGTGDYYDYDLQVSAPLTITDAIYQFDVILNNDYIGHATITNVNNNDLAIRRSIYFNGNHFTFNVYKYNYDNPVGDINIVFDSIVLNDKYQGTPESAESVIEVTDKNDEFNEQANDLYEFEGQFNSDLNDSLENIQVDFDVGNQFGSKFLASATWVKSQFDTLTSNTPFGTVLSFSLVLGLALLIIGKAIK